MQLRSWIQTLVSLSCCGFLAFGAAADEFEIGTVGSTLSSGDWERRSFAEGMGKDQFLLVGSDAYLVFLESFALFEQRSDYLEHIDVFLVGIEDRLQDSKLDPEIGFERYDGFSRATRRVIGHAAGIDLAYQFDVISAGNGVGYLLLSWTKVPKTQRLQAALDELLQTFTFPGPESEWFEKTQPSAHLYDYGEWKVEISFRDSVFTESDSKPRERYSLTADNGDLGLHLFIDELEGDADEILDDVRAVAADDEPWDELLRTDFESEIGPGRQLLMRDRSELPTDLAIAIIKLDDEHWIDLRMVTGGSSGHREELWNRLLSSLRVEREAPVDAFPIVEDAIEDGDEPYYTSSARSLLETSQFLAESPWPGAAEMASDGAVLIREGKKILLVPADSDSDSAEPVVLYRSDAYFYANSTAWGADTLLVGIGEEVQWIVEGELQPAGFRADLIAPAGEELLIARSQEAKSLLGLGELPVVGATQILLRTRAGKERSVLEFADRQVDALAFRHGRALVAAAPRGIIANGMEEASVELQLIDLESGSSRRLERWRKVERIAAGTDGWLVSGTASNGDPGIYLLADGGPRELLLSGDQVGLAADLESLVFVADRCLGRSTDSRHCVYRTPLSAAREFGSEFWPFNPRRLGLVATAAFERIAASGTDPMSPSTPEEIATLVGVAEEEARRLIGTPLPTTAEGIDLLVASLAYDREISEEVVAILGAMVTQVFLQEGGKWVPPATSTSSSHRASGWETENPFALGLHPASVVLSTLYDDESWYLPIAQIKERANGRILFLGPDPKAVRDAVRGADLPNLSKKIRQGDADELGEFLTARKQNLYLRDKVYKQLAAYGREEILESVANRLVSGEDAAVIDLVAATAGRLAGDLSTDKFEGLIRDLRDGIEKNPQEVALYLLLGSVYEQSSIPDKVKYGRACYEKAVELQPYGPHAEAANEALEGLGGSEG